MNKIKIIITYTGEMSKEDAPHIEWMLKRQLGLPDAKVEVEIDEEIDRVDPE